MKTLTSSTYLLTQASVFERLGPIAGSAAIALTMTATATIADTAQISFGYEFVNGVKIFYRKAGDPTNPSIIMLHGFPISSHQYRSLIRDLSEDYHVIAPDYPGCGSNDAPFSDSFTYTFDNLADHIHTFIEQRSINEYALIMHDCGAPIGFRIALDHPERVSALLIQNGNAYIEGVSPAAAEPLQALWENRTPEVDAEVAANLFNVGALQWQYTHGTRNPEGVLPDNWLMNLERVERDGQHTVQLDLLTDLYQQRRCVPSMAGLPA